MRKSKIESMCDYYRSMGRPLTTTWRAGRHHSHSNPNCHSNSTESSSNSRQREVQTFPPVQNVCKRFGGSIVGGTLIIDNTCRIEIILEISHTGYKAHSAHLGLQLHHYRFTLPMYAYHQMVHFIASCPILRSIPHKLLAAKGIYSKAPDQVVLCFR